MAALPRLTFWAWERPEDLRAIDPSRQAVAVLDETIVISDEILVRPQLNSLRLAPGTKIISVVRLEAARNWVSADNAESARRVVAAMLHAVRRPGAVALQVDFDATQSQRPFYRELLSQLRRQMPADMPLSMTALASWCAGDDWLRGLPVDEAVPMYFRMGPDRRELDSTNGRYPIREPLCAGSAGISTDERWPKLDYVSRVYVFHSRGWTESSVRGVVHKIDR